MNEIFIQIEVRSGSFGTLTGIWVCRVCRVCHKQSTNQMPISETKTAGLYAKTNWLIVRRKAAQLLKSNGTLLLCRIGRDVKRFVDLAALDLALHIFFSSSWSSVRSWCLYSRPVFHPYWDLSASKINFRRSWSSSIPLSKAWLVFSTYRSFGRQSGRLQWHL